MPDSLPTYELYAIRYATREGRRADNFLGGDPHDGPMRMDYFVWVAIGAERSFMMDSGFTAEMAVKRKREFLAIRSRHYLWLGFPQDGEGCGADTSALRSRRQFRQVFCGAVPSPGAGIHYATGRYMRHPFLNHAFEVEDVVGIVRLNYGGRVTFYRGNDELAPGITLHLAADIRAGCNFFGYNTQRRLGRPGSRCSALFRTWIVGGPPRRSSMQVMPLRLRSSCGARRSGKDYFLFPGMILW